MYPQVITTYQLRPYTIDKYYFFSKYINNSSAVSNILMLSTKLKFFSYTTSQQPPPQDHLHFVMLLKIFGVLFTNFWNPPNPIFSAHYILQYCHLDVWPDLVHNIYGTVIYIAYCEYVLSLRMAFIAKTCCWSFLIGKVVYIIYICIITSILQNIYWPVRPW